MQKLSSVNITTLDPAFAPGRACNTGSGRSAYGQFALACVSDRTEPLLRPLPSSQNEAFNEQMTATNIPVR